MQVATTSHRYHTPSQNCPMQHGSEYPRSRGQQDWQDRNRLSILHPVVPSLQTRPVSDQHQLGTLVVRRRYAFPQLSSIPPTRVWKCCPAPASNAASHDDGMKCLLWNHDGSAKGLFQSNEEGYLYMIVRSSSYDTQSLWLYEIRIATPVNRLARPCS